MLAIRLPRLFVPARFVAIAAGVLLLAAGSATAQTLPTGSTGARAGTRVRIPETPQSLYDKGLNQMKRGLWDDAVLSFEKVRNHFPFNQYSVL